MGKTKWQIITPGTSIASLLFWGFMVVKVVGHSFAHWSWWWILLPIVPWLGLLVTQFNL